MTWEHAQIFAIQRPHPKLLNYYILIACCSLVGMPIVLLPLFFKYHTMRYRFDDKGISMSWGLLFRQEIYLTYRKIQDIHLTRNLIERWMGLGTLKVQTASGSSSAEMSIVGILELEQLRDFIYLQMKGHEGTRPAPSGEADEKLRVLRAIDAKLEALATRLEARDV